MPQLNCEMKPRRFGLNLSNKQPGFFLKTEEEDLLHLLLRLTGPGLVPCRLPLRPPGQRRCADCPVCQSPAPGLLLRGTQAAVTGIEMFLIPFFLISFCEVYIWRLLTAWEVIWVDLQLFASQRRPSDPPSWVPNLT